jgi:uncharacterized protein (DUF302 family)
MDACSRRIVVDLTFERALGEAVHAVCDEGLQVIARIDVRDHFRQSVRHDFRRYVLLHLWSPDFAFSALRHDLESGAILPTTLALFELPDGETAVVVNQRLAPISWNPPCRRNNRELAVMADHERERIARVLMRLQRAGSQQPTVAAA